MKMMKKFPWELDLKWTSYDFCKRAMPSEIKIETIKWFKWNKNREWQTCNSQVTYPKRSVLARETKCFYWSVSNGKGRGSYKTLIQKSAGKSAASSWRLQENPQEKRSNMNNMKIFMIFMREISRKNQKSQKRHLNIFSWRSNSP